MEKEHVRKLAGQTAVYGISSILGRILNYLLTPILVRVFTAHEYGINTEFYAYVSFLIILFTYGMETAYFRFINSEPDKQKVFDTSLISLIISSLIFSGLFIFLSEPFANLIEHPDHPEYIIWFAIILGLDAISVVPFSDLRVKNRAFTFAALKLTNIGLNILLVLFFLVACPYIIANGNFSSLHSFVDLIYDPSIGLGYVFISNMVASAVTIIMLFPVLFKVKFHFDIQLWKRMMKYSLPMIIVGFAGMVNETMNRILLKFYLPFSPVENLTQIGIYGACVKLSLLMTLFIQAYRMAAEPFFFSHSGKSDSREVYAGTMKYFAIACSFIFLFVMLYIDIFKFFIGDEGSVYHTGLPVVPVLLLANICLGIYYNLSIWYKLTNHTQIGAVIALGGAAVTLSLNILWIPEFGFKGSAWATLICYASMMIASYFSGQKYFPVNYNIIRIGGYIILAVLLYFLSVIFKELIPPGLVIQSLLSTTLLLLFAGIVFYLEKVKKSVT